MNRIVIVLIALFAYTQVTYAQHEVRDINAIKCNQNYIYATGTSVVSVEEASQNAKDLINAEIADWLKKNMEADVTGYIAKSQEQLGLIQTQRGNLFRVFVYVHKADILPYYKDEMVITGTLNNKLEEAKIESSVVKTKSASQDSIKEQLSITQKQEELATLLVEESRYIPNDSENNILKIKTFIELNQFINEGRENQNIVQVGNYSTLPSEGVIYVFIHNREGLIPACMKIVNGHILNLSTGTNDQITNYKGCGAIWVRFKKV